MALLEIDKLTMRFGGLTAVNALDLRIDQGQIFSIIGPNGAGKTTVFNAITGIYEPTSGEIQFEGRRLQRAFTWRVALGCVLVGIATSLGAALFSINIDRLWWASIKVPNADPALPFTYAEAGRRVGGYLRGDPVATPQRGTRWDVTSADGLIRLGEARSRDDAMELRDAFAAALGGAGLDAVPVDGRWRIVANDATLATVVEDNWARQRAATIALIAGLVGGMCGALVVWNRSRRTPDVISQQGIARTFQNIRLFRNMTVMENVQVGLDRETSANPLRMALRTRGLKQEELASRYRAKELLKFVGLREKSDLLAGNLAYGDQRRLEIARALATSPRLLLLDEPAAGMNPAESAALTHLIREIRNSGVTVLLIEHHMNVVMDISDRIAVLDYGGKIAEGTPAEVRNDPKVIEAYLGRDDHSAA